MAITLSKGSSIRFYNQVGSGKIPGRLLSWEYSQSYANIDITTLSSTRRVFISQEMLDGEFSCEVQFDLADVGQIAMHEHLESGSIGTGTLMYIYPGGNVSGQIEIKGVAIISSHNVAAADVDSVITASFSGHFRQTEENLIP